MAIKRRRGKQSVHNQTQAVRNERARDARNANPATARPASSSNDRRTLNLESGSFTEELPTSGYATSPGEPRRPTIRRGNWEIEPEGSGVRATRKFKNGGRVGRKKRGR